MFITVDAQMLMHTNHIGCCAFKPTSANLSSVQHFQWHLSTDVVILTNGIRYKINTETLAVVEVQTSTQYCGRTC